MLICYFYIICVSIYLENNSVGDNLSKALESETKLFSSSVWLK